MKNKLLNAYKVYFKACLLFLFIFLSFATYGQENSISPIFALAESNSSFNNDIVALNQIKGSEYIIESFSNQSLFGKNYTVSTQKSSNLDHLYLLRNPNTIDVYNLPYFFDPNYTGEQTSFNLNNNINDLEYHLSENIIFAYSLSQQELYSIQTNDGTVANSYSIPFSSESDAFSLKSNQEYLLLSGKENDSVRLCFYNIANQSIENTTLSTQYTNFYIVSHSSLPLFYAVAQDLNHVNWLLSIDPNTMMVSKISALASCSNCTDESFDFDQNALAIDWAENTLLAVLSQEINNLTNYQLLNINLANGNIKHHVSLKRKLSNLYFNKAASGLVFPGDANHDGLVNMKDLFSIGLKYTFNCVPRFTQTTDWVGQHSFDTGIEVQGVDVKHADCNGDGQINALDIEVIKANYSSVHNSNKSASASSGNCDYPLAFSFIETAYESNDVAVNIKLGESFDPVSNVYGVSFTMLYDNSFVVPNTMQTTGLSSWFGDDGVNYTHLSEDSFLIGSIDISLTGIDLQNRSGGGDILQVTWTMEDDVIPVMQQTENMNLRIVNINIINLAEDELDGCGIDTNIVVNKKSTVGILSAENNQINIYPNPTNDYIYIESPIKINALELYSISGGKIKTVALDSLQGVSVSTLAKGIYFLKLYTKEGTYFERILIE